MDVSQSNNRILIIDDNPSIHNDFSKILTPTKKDNEEINELEMSLFGKKKAPEIKISLSYNLDYALSGKQAVEMVEKARNEKTPYALAFVDVRMPPGLDGIETISRIWEIDPNMEMAITTAYSDYSWDEIVAKFGLTDKIIIIKKPFEKIEIKQAAAAMIRKWNIANKARSQVTALNGRLLKQTETIGAIFEFANMLNTMGSLNEICSYIIEFVKRFLQCERISIMLADEKQQNLTIIESTGLSDDITQNTVIEAGSGITGKAFELEEILCVNNLEEAGYEKKYSPYDSFMSVPFLCVPLVGNKIKIGVINVTNRKDNIPFSQDDISIMSYIAYTAAVALNNQINEMKLEETFLGSIKALVGAIEAKDPYTKGHSERVSELSRNIAERLGLSTEEIKVISFAGLVHDIGKIGIPGDILRKPDLLSDGELAQIKKHPEIGENILKNIKFLNKVKDIIRHHHERLDGSGYPDGLCGNQITMETRILSVADTYDAMISDRPYRKGIPKDQVKMELLESSGIKLDFTCVRALLDYLGL